MKLLRSLTCLIITLQFSMAQFVTVQGVIRDNESSSIPDGDYTITFKLYSSESGGSASWTEEQTLTVVNGVYGVELGTAESLTSLDWGTQFWLEIASITGASFSTNEALSPRTRMTMTPYAIMAGMSGTTNVMPQDGNVGIGTTSPSFKLDVQPSSKNARIGRAEVGGWPANSGYAYFGNQNLNHNGSGNYALLQSTDGHTFLNAVSGKMLRFRINNADKMTIASNGYVGIGTTTPNYPLEVSGQILTTGGVHVTGDWYRINGNGGLYFQNWGGGWHMTDATWIRSYGSKRVYSNSIIRADGGFQVDGNTVIDDGAGWHRAYNNTGIYFASHGGGFHMTDGTWVRIYNGKNFYWGNAEAKGRKLSLDHGGNNTSLYNDNSGIIFYAQHSNHGNNRYARWDGDGNLDSWSDRRLKQDIENEKNLLDRIMQVRVRNFYWKDYLEAQYKEVGFIAQEVEPHFPHLVSELKNPETDVSYKSLATSDFGILAFGGVRELKLEKDAEITNLESHIDELNTQMEEKDRAIEKIESELRRIIELLEN